MTIAAHHPAQLDALTKSRDAFRGYIPERITNGNSTGNYRTDHPICRPGATDHESMPSRMGNVLVYRNGEVAEV